MHTCTRNSWVLSRCFIGISQKKTQVDFYWAESSLFNFKKSPECGSWLQYLQVAMSLNMINYVMHWEQYLQFPMFWLDAKWRTVYISVHVQNNSDVLEHDKLCNALRTVFTISNVLTGCKVTYCLHFGDVLEHDKLCNASRTVNVKNKWILFL